MMKVTAVLVGFLVLFSGCGLGPDMSRDRVPRTPSPTPWQGEKPIEEYMREGSAAYRARDYTGAIASYKGALEQEQRQPKLEKKLWYELVTNLAASYNLAGDSKNSRLVLAYGISKEYSYPMFHYVLATTYGEEGDEAGAIRHLSAAYKNKKNMVPGEKFPDPLTDDSFASFSASADFKKAVAEMKRGL